MAKKLFVAFLGINKFHWVGLRFVCWFYDWNTQRLTVSGFMKKPVIEPATSGLHGIGLSPTPFYVAFLGANQFRQVDLRFVCWFYYENTQRLTESCIYREARNKTCDPWFTRQNNVALLDINQFRRVGLKFVCWFYDGNSRRLNRKWFYGEAGNLTCNHWFTKHRFIPYTKKRFVAFLGINQFWWFGLSFVQCGFMMGTPNGSPKKIIFV